MCQIRIVLKRDNQEEVLLENVASLKVTDEGILVHALFEEPQCIREVTIDSVDFLENKLTLIKKGMK